jgi:hypothetical protein
MNDYFFKGSLQINQPIEPSITFHPGDPSKEVMRIDRHGVRVNPEYAVDEATQHVLNALTSHIQHTTKHAVIQERERAALKVEELGMIGYGTLAIAAAIRRGDQE